MVLMTTCITWQSNFPIIDGNGLFLVAKLQIGVPQGSVLGPLFFLIYINDLHEGLKSDVKPLADNTSLFSV